MKAFLSGDDAPQEGLLLFGGHNLVRAVHLPLIARKVGAKDIDEVCERQSFVLVQIKKLALEDVVVVRVGLGVAVGACEHI